MKDKIYSKSSLSLLLALVFLLILVFSLTYVFSKVYYQAQEYYELNLESDFFEEITPGTKVRFQASLIVGEVDRIETDLDVHRIVIKLKRDFYIPKSGSSVSLKTWGYFGSKFINIDAHEGAGDNIPYLPGDTVPMESSENLNQIMQTFHELVKDDRVSGNVLLSKKLKEVKKMIYQLKRAVYSGRKTMTKEKRRVFRAGMRNIGEVIQELKKNLEGANADIEQVLKETREQIPKMQEKTEQLKEWTNYRNRLKSFFTRYAYDESDYELLRTFMSLVRRKTKKLRDNPSLVLGTD